MGVPSPRSEKGVREKPVVEILINVGNKSQNVNTGGDSCWPSCLLLLLDIHLRSYFLFLWFLEGKGGAGIIVSK